MSDIYYDYRLNEKLIDIRKVHNHPLVLRYTEIYEEVLVNADISKGRVAPNFILNINAPFFVAAQSGIKNVTNPEKCYKSVFNSLWEFYGSFQPLNAEEWFSIQDTNPIIKRTPPWGAILPWRVRSIDNFKKVIEQGTLSDNQKNGLDLSIHQSGWAYCGPVVEEKCHLETRRIVDLIYSIRKKGYQRNNEKDGDIVATALIDDNNDWKWLVTNGYHRAAVLAAMNYESIPIRINLVIRRNEVDYWPQVSNCIYTKEQALNIFDNLKI